MLLPVLGRCWAAHTDHLQVSPGLVDCRSGEDQKLASDRHRILVPCVTHNRN